MPKMMKKNVRQKDDVVKPVDQASQLLKNTYGTGWSVRSIKRNISEGRPFMWIQGVHYFCSNRGINSLNISAIEREISIMG